MLQKTGAAQINCPDDSNNDVAGSRDEEQAGDYEVDAVAGTGYGCKQM